MTRRIIPETTESSCKGSAATQNNINEQEDDENLLKNEKKAKRPLILGFLLSVRLFLIIVIMAVVLLTALSIWLTSYKVNQDQSLEAVNVLISNIREKVSNFLNSQLLPAKQVAQQMAYDYHNAYVKMDDSALPYVFSKMKVYNITLANLCYGEVGLNVMQAVTVDETKGLLVWAKKNLGESFTTWILDSNTGAVVKSYGLILPAYTVGKMDYYLESLSLFKTYPEGAFGNVYQVVNSSMQTYFTIPIYNTTSSTKQRLGVSKVNISLTLIGKFLATVQVLTRGFVIVSEFKTDYVIGSSLDIPELLMKRIFSVNITKNNAGNIMKKFYEISGGVESYQTSVMIDGKTYLVSSSAYGFENIKWRMTLVFEEDEIMEGIIVSSYIILGVTIGVCLLGILISILIGYIVTNPFVQLEKDFKKIELLDLANIQPRSSLFSEAANIYTCLTTTVQWLKDFKSFLPDSVLNQLSETKPEMNEQASPAGDSSLRESESAINISNRKSETLSRHSSQYRQDKKRDLFKLGLSIKECCVLNISIHNMDDKYFTDPDLLSQTVSKVLTGISTICKTVRADLQIKSYDEFLVIFADRPQVSNVGLETALKIVSGIGHLNDSLTKNGHGKLSISIGIASGNSLQGNVGNKQTRYFAMIGTIVERAKDLCFMSSQFDTPVLADQITFKHGKQFVFRPVDRVKDKDGNLITVHELLKKNLVENDEWLYELEQKKQNSKHNEYANSVDKLFQSRENTIIPTDELNSIRECLLTYQEECPNDKVVKRMASLSTQHANNFSNYHSQVDKIIRSYLDGDRPVHINE